MSWYVWWYYYLLKTSRFLLLHYNPASFIDVGHNRVWVDLRCSNSYTPLVQMGASGYDLQSRIVARFQLMSTLYPCCPTKQLNMLIGTSYWRGLHWFHVEKYAGLHVQNVQLRSVRWVNNKVQNTSHVHIKSRSLSPIYYYKNSVWMLQAEAIHMWYHKS